MSYHGDPDQDARRYLGILKNPFHADPIMSVKSESIKVHADDTKRPVVFPFLMTADPVRQMISFDVGIGFPVTVKAEEAQHFCDQLQEKIWELRGITS